MCTVQTAHDVTRHLDCPTTEYLTCAWSFPVLCTRSPTPVMILVTAHHVTPVTYTPQDKQTRFSTCTKIKVKTTEMSQIRIQTIACQWLITIKLRYDHLVSQSPPWWVHWQEKHIVRPHKAQLEDQKPMKSSRESCSRRKSCKTSRRHEKRQTKLNW
jgi:hypothetical protein